MTTTEQPILAWWFAPESLTLDHGDGRRVVVGETLSVAGPIVPCQSGLHASIRAIDALKYTNSAIICRVEMSGTIVHDESGDKLAASHREVLAMADVTKALRLYGAWFAEQALLGERAAGREPDPLSFAVLEVVRRFAIGEATVDELSAARSAAVSAALSAESAAWSAARSAARSAAESAAWSAAVSAWSAAWSAARSAAESAAWSAARSAARSAQNTELERLFDEALAAAAVTA